MSGHFRRLVLVLAALFVALAAPAFASAQDLRIAMKAAVDSADPHQLFTPNRNVQQHVFEPLIFQDEHLKPLPGLAESWRLIDPTTWEFKLRQNVKFHDGTPFTARDVEFSIKRAQAITGVRTYRHYLKDIVGFDIVDDHTLRIRTSQPSALLISNLSTLGMVSAKLVEGAPAEGFNTGALSIGTGPYRWVRFVPNQEIVLERNENYWGGVEPWAKVTIRFIGNDSARVAALLSNEVDVIDAVPGSLFARVKDSASARLVADTSIFMLYMTLDRFRDVSPFVRAADGKPLAKNPLKDTRVLEAMSRGVNRQALADRVMDGGAEPAGQFAPPGFAGHDPSLKPLPYEPQKAKQILADAGWPRGFELTLHCLNDRFSGDIQTCQAIGSMLTAIGVRSKVEGLPSATFFRRANSGGPNGEPEFSAAMSIFGSSSGDPIQSLVTLVETVDAAKGHGGNNRGRYSNPEVDRLTELSQQTLDDAAREKLVWEATRIAMAENGVFPIYFLKSSWGVSRKLTLLPRGDQYTLATRIRPAQ
ncbi:ABC transporter substrate-binding protein [Terrarubrum flagellatum]|uniref:ABC transporter substrate-binding protein n=1 Tax=Terrirubrum flagellatum TaxID=2895980 RepID=UPI0031452E61